MKTGGCLCGEVTYAYEGPSRPVIVCHCTQCRKQTGSAMHATSVAIGKFRITSDKGLKWYRASNTAQRGFCATCGSNLFWKPDSGERISFTAGSIDGDTGLAIEGHIYCDYKGDYYEIPNGEGYRKGEWDK